MEQERGGKCEKREISEETQGKEASTGKNQDKASSRERKTIKEILIKGGPTHKSKKKREGPHLMKKQEG